MYPRGERAMSEEMRLPIECSRHHIIYDAWDSHCPECKKEYEAGERIARRFVCLLCEQFKGSTKMYCGGPVAFMCDDCKKILDKYFELRDKYEDFWDNMRQVQKSNQKAI